MPTPPSNPDLKKFSVHQGRCIDSVGAHHGLFLDFLSSLHKSFNPIRMLLKKSAHFLLDAIHELEQGALSQAAGIVKLTTRRGRLYVATGLPWQYSSAYP